MKSGRAGGETLCETYGDCGKKSKRGLQAARGERELEFVAVKEGGSERRGEGEGGRERPEKENQTLTPAVWCVGRDLRLKDTEKGRWIVGNGGTETPAGGHRPSRAPPTAVPSSGRPPHGAPQPGARPRPPRLSPRPALA